MAQVHPFAETKGHFAQASQGPAINQPILGYFGPSKRLVDNTYLQLKLPIPIYKKTISW